MGNGRDSVASDRWFVDLRHYYGWQSPNCKLKFQYVQTLVHFYLGWCWLMKREEPIEAISRPPIRCRDCGVGHLHLTLVTDADGRVLYRRTLRESTQSRIWIPGGPIKPL